MAQEKILYLHHGDTRLYHNGVFIPFSAGDHKRLSRGALIPLSLLELHTLKLSDSLSEEEKAIQIEIRMYEEGHLNTNEEYTISYLRHELPDENSTLFSVFALSKTKAAEYFSPYLSEFSSIDLIVPEIMIYESFYDTDTLQGNDLFIYLAEDEAYGVLYQNGRLIAHRSLESLSTLAKECALSTDTLLSHLTGRGIIDENYPTEESDTCLLIQKLLSRNVERLIHMINHKRGLFGFSDIDRVYFDFKGSSIPGIETIFEAYGIHNAVFSPLSKTDLPEIGHDLLCAEYLSRHIRNPDFNLSAFTPQAPWYKRHGGKLLSTLAASLFIAIAAPLTLSWSIKGEEKRYAELSAHLAQTSSKTTELSKILNDKNTLLSKYRNDHQILFDDVAMIKESQKIVEQITQIHHEREQMLHDAASVLGAYRLGALMIEQNGSENITLHIVSDYAKRDDIAKVMNDLYTMGYSDVETREIKLDENTYNAMVKVTR